MLLQSVSVNFFKQSQKFYESQNYMTFMKLNFFILYQNIKQIFLQNLYRILQKNQTKQKSQVLKIYKMENFCNNIRLIMEEDTSEEQLFLKTGFNVFIIGFKQSGKSTLANVMSDQKQLYFSQEGNLFRPINKNYFPIIDEDYPGTQQRKSIICQDFQIWDFPGYGMGEDAMKQIETRIQQIVLINKSNATHIVIVVPYSQFSQDRGENLIQISNLIAQNDLTASIIISKAPPKVKLQTLIGKIQSQLEQEDNIYTEEAKMLLNLIIQNNRIQLFHYPQVNENKYTFDQNRIQQLKELVLNKKYFQNVIIKFKFISSDKVKVDEFMSQLQYNLQVTQDKMIMNQISINIQLIQPLQSDEKQQVARLFSQYKQLQQIFGLNEWNQQKSNQQIHCIQDFFNQKDIQVMNNKLHVNCTKFDLLELQKIYIQNKDIQEIYIYSLYEFYVNSDIEMPGVHIYIKCKNFRVQKKCLINLKGQTGQPFLEKAKNGDEQNNHGDDGQEGNQGQSGGTIYVDAEEYFNIQLLEIDISGGDGGKGQDGGDGFDGTKGVDGNEQKVKQKKEQNESEKWEEVPTNLLETVFQHNRVFLYYYRSKGKPGTVGGNAGSKGKGGVCGSKGIIYFQNFDAQQINQKSNNSYQGIEGIDGQPGMGGQYGTDYVGQFQEVRLLGFINKPEQLQKQVSQEKEQEQNQQQENPQIQQNDANQNNTGGSVLVGQAIGGGVGVGAGIEGREICIQGIAKQGLGVASTIGAFAILGVQVIAIGADLVLRSGWNYIKMDEESPKRADSGLINKQVDNQLQQKKVASQENDMEIFQQLRLKYFEQFQKDKMNQMIDQFKHLSLSEQQISQIFGMK
ncbi:hypothetical protein pb186bvf_001748 [Paramecium bursaria]